MSEILEILRNTPSLTLGGVETSGEEIKDLIFRGIKYKEVERQLKEGGVLHD